jgi:hypothetical protein
MRKDSSAKCHTGEPHAGERQNTDVLAGPLAEQDYSARRLTPAGPPEGRSPPLRGVVRSDAVATDGVRESEIRCVFDEIQNLVLGGLWRLVLVARVIPKP